MFFLGRVVLSKTAITIKAQQASLAQLFEPVSFIVLHGDDRIEVEYPGKRMVAGTLKGEPWEADRYMENLVLSALFYRRADLHLVEAQNQMNMRAVGRVLDLLNDQKSIGLGFFLR